MNLLNLVVTLAKELLASSKQHLFILTLDFHLKAILFWIFTFNFHFNNFL